MTVCRNCMITILLISFIGSCVYAGHTYTSHKIILIGQHNVCDTWYDTRCRKYLNDWGSPKLPFSVHWGSPRREQPLYKGQSSWICPPKCPLFGDWTVLYTCVYYIIHLCVPIIYFHVWLNFVQISAHSHS